MRFLPCKIFIYSILLFACIDVQAQKASRPEKFWAFTHPFVAKKAFRLTKKVLAVCDSLKKIKALDGIGNGDQLDAFRHSYWMAFLTQHMGSNKVYKLGLAHEKGNKIAFKKGKLEDNARPDSLSSVMDIFNNAIGSDIGLKLKKEKIKITEKELIAEMIGQVTDGNMRILAKNKAGDFLDCSGKVLDLSAYKEKWSIPKCLIGSYAAPQK